MKGFLATRKKYAYPPNSCLKIDSKYEKAKEIKLADTESENSDTETEFESNIKEPKEIIEVGKSNQSFWHTTEEEKKTSKQGNDFTAVFPEELIVNIFSHLNAENLTRCGAVNITCNRIVNTQSLWDAPTSNLPEGAFGKEQWMKYLGDIGEEPPLPKSIHKILKSPCPFFLRKQLKRRTCLSSFQKLLMASLSIQ